MQRIGDLNAWTEVREGVPLVLANSVKKGPRRIRLSVNSAGPLTLYVGKAGGDRPLQFLSVSTGLDVIEFWYEGDVVITPDGNGYVRTADGTPTHVAKTDHRTFTEIVDRRPRNHQLELMMYEMRKNQERMMAQVQAEAERRMEEIKNAGKPPAPAAAQDDQGGGSGKPAKAKPKPGGGGKPAEPAKGSDPEGDDDDGASAS